MKTTLIHSNSSASLSSIPSKQNLPGYSPDGVGGGKWEQAPQSTGCATSFGKCCANAVRRKNIEKTFPILKWLPKYTKQQAIADLIAGVTVGLTVLPQGLAYATVAGLEPIYGLYSSFVGCFVYIFFGSTKEITIGPTAIQSVLTNKYTHGKPPEYAIFLAAVTAVVTMTMGILRLGFIANFISRPVISGFTSAVSLTIVATQIKALLGLKFDQEGFLPTVRGVISHFSEIKMPDAYLSVVCITILLIMKKLQWILSPLLKNRPGLDRAVWFFSTARSALVLGICSVITATMKTEFSLVGHIPAGIPAFKPPPTEIVWQNRTHTFTDILQEEASALIVLPLLGVMGHITIAKAFARPKRVDCTQEILCIGISNSISCFFSSYSIGGSFSRTTVNAMSGVETPLGGLYTGTMVLIALQFLTPYFAYIPKAALASVISACVIFMFDLDIILPLWRSKRMDMIPWAVTFLVTLGLGLEFGILVGLCISTIYLLYYAARPRVRVLEAETSRQGTKFIMIVLDRSLTFPSVDYITYETSKSVSRFANKKTPAVIDCVHINYTDFTAAEAMKDMMGSLEDQGYHLIFYNLKPSMLRIMKGVMHGSKANFIHCETESDLESLIDGNFARIRKGTKNGPAQSIRALLKSLMSDSEEMKPIRHRSIFE